MFNLKDKTAVSKMTVQPKLEINLPGDRHEQEADAMADHVMGTPRDNNTGVGMIARSIQRKGANGMPATASLASSLDRAGGGVALPGKTRSFMENSFSADFSGVRVHTGVMAAAMNTSIRARAFTVGNDIYFNDNEYNPETGAGKKLLAHELTHTIQQGGKASSVQRKSVYDDTAGSVTKGTDASGSTIYTGSVDRREYRNEADKTARTNAIHQADVNVRYNESTCQLVVPMTILFVNQAAGSPTHCGDITGAKNDPIKPVSQDRFNKIKKSFLTGITEGINGWYTVILDGDSCSPCKEVPVTVEFTEVTSGAADRTVIITANEGRSYAGSTTIGLCDENDTEVLIHEAGHFALGIGDEYHEEDAKRPEERERPGEYSRMAQDAPGRLLEFHDRHFNFAEVFLRSVYPACNPRLHRTRNGPVEFTINVGIPQTYFTDKGNDLGFSLGLQFGIPLTTMRHLSLTLGPNFTYLLQDQQFLAGFRVGLEGRIPLGFVGSLNLKGFGEAGGSVDFKSSEPYSKPLTPYGTTPKYGGYAEAGGGVGLKFGNIFNVSIEAAGGALDLGRTSKDGKDAKVDYFRTGLLLGGSF